MRALTLTALIALAAALATAAPAAAEPFGLKDFDVAFTDAKGAEVTQAGSHPYQMEVSFGIATKPRAGGGVNVSEPLKDLNFTQIAGFIGNPTAVPRCTAADFLTPRINLDGVNMPSCSDSSAVGLVSAETITTGAVNVPIWSPVYDLVPPPGKAAKLGFWTGGVPVTIELGVKESSPYNIVGGPTNVTQILEVSGSRFQLWGVPADPAHDPLRGFCASGTGPEPTSFGKCPAGVSKKPFLTLPRACEGPLPSSYEADSWEHPGVFSAKGSVLTHDSAGEPQGMSGCGKVGFGPEVAIGPGGSEEAESAAGLDMEIAVEDENLANPDYEAVAEADIKAVEFALPAGMTLNPSAAEGLGVCSKAQYDAESLSVHGCPPASKLGTIEAQTPILENHTFKGSIYLAQQDNPETTEPGAENPFDSLLAAYIVVRDQELGAFTKFAAQVETDEQSGQVITRVENLPPIPFSQIKTHLRSGPRAPFITPPACGTYHSTVALTPSSGAVQVTHPSFEVTSGPGGGPCPGPTPAFTPGFEAGAANNAASQYSPFSMRITRADGQQDITRFSATLPPGVLTNLTGIAKCSDAAIEAAKNPLRSGRTELASPSCPAASKIGTVLGGAGVGSALTYVPGSLYLAGPYHGTPLSVVAIVPAVAGPFDVGVVLTRVGLNLNPTTFRGEVDGAASDPIPHILKGIPLKLRDLRVYADRPQFTFNSTSCTPSQTAAQIFGSGANPFSPADDAPVGASSRYQAASCASLAFKPKLALQLKGGTKRNDHPALTAKITYPYPSGPGYANIGKAVTVLPHSEFLDPNHLSNPCTRVQFNANACPPDSVLGTAKAVSPLLDEALEGPVYFRSNGGERKVPDVVIALHGLFDITLIGKVDSVVHGEDSRIRTTFDEVPDAPVTSFTLKLKGGKEGLLVNSANLCRQKPRAKISMRGQNGKRYDTEPLIKTSCKKKGKGKGA
jgi:hypothetical protein